MTFALIADDLTGALDAAAPFAAPGAPVHLLLRLSEGLPDRLCHSTESRDLRPAAAVARVAAAQVSVMAAGHPRALWFKKVDSVLRGHPLAETLSMARAGGFARCVFAPAFPEMGRITRQGRQLVRTPSGYWQGVGPGDLRQALAALVPRFAPGLGVVVIDAEDQTTFQTAIAPWRNAQSVLWAGSRGLAQALAPPIRVLPRPPVGAFILGTSHPATRAQTQGLADLRRAGPGAVPDAATPLLIDPVPDCTSGAQTRVQLGKILRELAPPADGSALLVTGGDCLSILLRAVGAQGLGCLGEIAPGLPLSRILGGRLAGVTLISKSGGFGGPTLLSDMRAT